MGRLTATTTTTAEYLGRKTCQIAMDRRLGERSSWRSIINRERVESWVRWAINLVRSIRTYDNSHKYHRISPFQDMQCHNGLLWHWHNLPKLRREPERRQLQLDALWWCVWKLRQMKKDPLYKFSKRVEEQLLELREIYASSDVWTSHLTQGSLRPADQFSQSTIFEWCRE